MDTVLKQQGVNNVKVVSLHPGAVRTELGRNMFSNPIIEWAVFFITSPFYYLLTKSSLEGAQTSLHCSLIDFDKLESGKYYADCAVKQEKMPNDNWAEEAAKLWTFSNKSVLPYIPKDITKS